MLKLTRIILQANQQGPEDASKLDNALISQANNGVTIEQCLKGHCSGPASNPVFIDGVVNQLKNSDGLAVTANSPLMSVIHQLDDKYPEAPAHDGWQKLHGTPAAV
jgi:hypothetical protein